MGVVSLQPTAGPADHGALLGLTDDDHLQYALLAGRVGGQTLVGSPTNGQDLTLAGNLGANPGFINANSPIIFGPYSGNPLAAYGFSYNATENISAVFIGGGLNFSGVITFTFSTFIYESYRGSPNITTGVAPGFAAYTVMQALPVLRGGLATFNPLSSLLLNAGVTMENFGVVVALTTANNFGLSFSPQTRVTGVFSTMTVTNQTAVSCRPTFSTIGSTTANLGTIRGLHQQSPAVALFQPQSGTETMIANIAVDVDNIVFGGNVTKAAVRSAQAAATNAYFLLNIGGAQSNFGGSFLMNCGLVQILSDTLGLSLGAAGGDIQLLWNGTSLEYDPLVGQELTLNFSIQSTRPTYIWQAENFGSSETAYTEARFAFDRFAFGQSGSIGNQIGVFVAPARTVAIAGGWADFLLTQAGNLDINGLNMSDLSAWAINAIVLDALGGGSIGDVATLRLGGMTTANLGGADTAALYQSGRRTARGVDSFEPLIPTDLTADVNDYAPATGNAMRQVWRMSTDDAGAVVITGIAVQQQYDTQWITNVGTVDNISLAHQNAGSAVANRIISPTGANLVLGPDESAELWYDNDSARWRILNHTGA